MLGSRVGRPVAGCQFAGSTRDPHNMPTFISDHVIHAALNVLVWSMDIDPLHL